jgi:hypothetical protein
MVQLAIRCTPPAAQPGDGLEGWLELEVKDLQAHLRPATVRLSRLTQPSPHLDSGWLIEVERQGEQPPLTEERLAELLASIRLLGVEPFVLAPAAAGNGWSKTWDRGVA